MRKIFKLIIFLLAILVAACGYSFLTDKSDYTQWQVSLKPGRQPLSWVAFQWIGDSIGKRYFPRAAMFVPCKVEGLPYNFLFQFDLGASRSAIYENNLRSFVAKYPDIKRKFRRLRSPLQFWNNKKALADVTIHFGDYTVSSTLSYFMKDYGQQMDISQAASTDTFQLGTIGADMFQGKVLIIDFPGQRFAICDSLPEAYKATFHDIQLDPSGRVLLPLQTRKRKGWIMFDNGSSIFDLIVPERSIAYYSMATPTDTIPVNSWGQRHAMIGRPISEPFTLAGQAFSNATIYADSRPDQDDNYDGIAGNALFWDHTVIINFKDKKFAVQ